MRSYIEIGSSPSEEDCAQVGTENYRERAIIECKRFIELIRRHLGQEPENAKLAIKSFEHDFGTYCEVVCYYSTDDEESLKYAFRCESNAPSAWHDDGEVT